jgi:hypothetical protein
MIEFRSCHYCGHADKKQYMHRDHMIPKSRGGSGRKGNVTVACPRCNLLKNDRTVEEFRFYLSHRLRARLPILFSSESHESRPHHILTRHSSVEKPYGDLCLITFDQDDIDEIDQVAAEFTA